MIKANNQTDEYLRIIKQRVAKYLAETSFNDDAQKMITLLYDTASGEMSETDLMKKIPPGKKAGRKREGVNKKDERDSRISKIQPDANRRLKAYGVKIGNTNDKLGRCFKQIPGYDPGNIDAVNSDSVSDQRVINPSNKQVIERCLLILCMRYGFQSMVSDNNPILSENQRKMTLEEIAKLYRQFYEKRKNKSKKQQNDTDTALSDRETFNWDDLSEADKGRLKKHVREIIYKKLPCVGNTNMIERGYITETRNALSGDIEYELGQKAFHILNLEKNYWLDELQPLIFTKGDTSGFSDTLRDISRQMDDFLYFDYEEKDKEEVVRNPRRFISFGIKQGDSKRIQNRINLYSKYDYKRKVLKLFFRDPESGLEKHILVKTGLLVYSRDKDSLFLIGRIVDENGNYLEEADEIQNNDLIMIEDSDDIKIRKTDMENEIYGAPRFENLFETMFVASVDPTFEVELHFKDFGNIRGKVERLKKSRSTKPTIDIIPWAEIEDRERACFQMFDDEPHFNVIRYRDRISGIEDLAKYLRGFGSSVLVIQPPQLRQRMQDSIERSLDAYGKEGYLE